MSDLPPAVATWRDQIERIPERASPCRYLTPTQWATFRESAIDFCDRFGAAALALGWTDRQLFGVHPDHGTLRVDYCGALMVAGKRATGVHADRVAFERTGAYRNTPGKVWGPPIWEFAAKGARSA
ncbi:hypothetical protein [Methylobacterium brachiatum]|uniref:hypothetical protein n=1 Tax=Methylobacterium brachiatum TaxID=269660 RepID=UPI0024476449|nr:hypothetical protein [Methylobacterium brachiatum]MDH2313175.1 hypothetical protein [Methylobacterium brachiatum]